MYEEREVRKSGERVGESEVRKEMRGNLLRGKRESIILLEDSRPLSAPPADKE
jgi:hypothetical protein